MFELKKWATPLHNFENEIETLKNKFADKVDLIHLYQFYRCNTKYYVDNQFVGIFVCIKGIPLIIYCIIRNFDHYEKSFCNQFEKIQETINKIIQIAEDFKICDLTKLQAKSEIKKEFTKNKIKFEFYDKDSDSVRNNFYLKLYLDDEIYEFYNVEDSKLKEVLDKLPEIENKYSYKSIEQFNLEQNAKMQKRLDSQISKLKKENYNIKFTEIDSSILKVTDQNKVISAVLKPYFISDILLDTSDEIDFDFYKAIILCNKLSYLFGYKPCYSSKSKIDDENSTNFLTWSKEPFVLCDYDADGFRIPTYAELYYANQEGYIQKTNLKEYVWSFNKKNLYLQDSEYNSSSSKEENPPSITEISKAKMCRHFLGKYEKLSNISIRLCRSAINNHTDATIQFQKQKEEKELAQKNEVMRLRNEKKANFEQFVNDVRTKNLSLYSNEEKEIKILDSNGINLIKVLGGSFVSRGLLIQEKKVNDFYMSQTVITREQYEKIVGKIIDNNQDSNNTPVRNLLINQIARFCNILSIKDNLEPCYYINIKRKPCFDVAEWDEIEQTGLFKPVFLKENLNGYRLPTEDEWMYAAKSGIYLEETKYSGSDILEEVAWSYKDNLNFPQEVAKKLPNKLGFYDMTGNVWEMCANNIAKGGSFQKDDEGMTINSKLDTTKIKKQENIGFRIVRSI